jgi:dihydroorotate dehydrogenase
VITWRLDRSFAWNASHPPKLPARPRKLGAGPGVRLFDRRVESPVGIAAGPLPNSRWIEAYARLGYGLLTYKTVRSAERPAAPAPNLLHCKLGDPALATPAPRPLDPAAVTWAVSLGMPSAAPAEWRQDVMRAKAKIRPGQMLIVSVAGTPTADGGDEALAEDYAQCARWAAEAGADVVEVHLACPASAGERPPMVFENTALSVFVLDRVRRAVGQRPVVAKLGATKSPRALHELASRLATRLDGFVLVHGMRRRVVKPEGAPAFGAQEREVATVVGAGIWELCAVQVEELVAWRKAGAWTKAILAVGGLTSPARIQAALDAGAEAVLVATAALTDPLIAARHRMSG